MAKPIKKPAAVAPEAAAIPPTALSISVAHLLIREGAAPKLGANSSGLIRYVVLTDASRSGLYLALTGNDGGGYFSREIVSINAIRACLSGSDDEQPVRSNAFKSAFIGQSTNNSGFLCAALADLGLLIKRARETAGRGQLLIDAGLWDEWRLEMLAPVTSPAVDLPVLQLKKAVATIAPALAQEETQEGTQATSAAEFDAAASNMGEFQTSLSTVRHDTGADTSTSKPSHRKAKQA